MSLSARFILRFTLPLLLLSTPLGAAGQPGQDERVPISRLRVTLEPVLPAPSLAERIERILQFARVHVTGVIRPKPGTKFRVVATAYSSRASETDRTPCITASGLRVSEDRIAANFLPIGTLLRIGEKKKTYLVADRMNQRYNGKHIIDIWHPTTKAARLFGKQWLTIEIIGYIPRSELKKLSRQRVERALARLQAESPDDAYVTATTPPGTFRRALADMNAFLGRFLTASLPITQEADCLTDDETDSVKP